MKKNIAILGILLSILFNTNLNAHCQMPCGIYHDEMVYDQIDQYAETMYKGVSVMNGNKLNSVHDFNELTRWIIEKEKESNETAQLISVYFLQQKIKPDDPDTTKRLIAAHKLLFLIVAIKQNNDTKFVEQFAKQWDEFKLMFHPEGYECKVEMLKMQKKQRELLEAKTNADQQNQNYKHDHDTDHNHDHEH